MTDLTKLREAAEKATPGRWRRVALGGASTILVEKRPARNDTRIPTYGYRDGGEHCLAYPFLDDKSEARLDFVCFSHADAEYIAALSPAATLDLLDELEALHLDLADTKANGGEAEKCLAEHCEAVAVAEARIKKLTEERAALLDRLERAEKALAAVTIYQIEGDDAVHINVCGTKIAAFGPRTDRAIALLKFEADRRAALSQAKEGDNAD